MKKQGLDHKWRQPTSEEIESIITLENTALRNLRITQAYHELAVALAGELGQTNVTWCVYPTWASRTAGVFIR